MGNAQSLDESISKALNDGWTITNIRKTFHVSHKRVRSIADGISMSHKHGRPESLSPDMIDYIEMLSLTNAMLSDGEIAARVNEKFYVNISRITVMRKRKKLGFIYRPPLTKQALSQEQKLLRLEFCKWIINNEQNIKNIVFSDESRFSFGPDNKWRRIKRGNWNDTCFIEKEKFNKSVMVWGAIGNGYKSALMKCSNGENAFSLNTSN